MRRVPLPPSSESLPRWSLRAYIRPGVDLTTRRAVCRMYIGIPTLRLQGTWLSHRVIRVIRVTSTSILIGHAESGEKAYWLWTRCKED
jgi:hypothetical protein